MIGIEKSDFVLASLPAYNVATRGVEWGEKCECLPLQGQKFSLIRDGLDGGKGSRQMDRCFVLIQLIARLMLLIGS
jgi:hypothetical protein